MKRQFISFVLILILLLSSCGAPIELSAPQTTSVSAETTADTRIPTADELRAEIEELKKTGDAPALFAKATELLKLEPGDANAYRVALDALVSMSGSNFDEINRLLEQAVENVDDPKQFAEWVNNNQPNYLVTMPFSSDVPPERFNTTGITPGNITNAAKYEEFGGWWISGLMTYQGDYVYISLPGENFAIYKMRENGENFERIGDTHGTNLNVIGDWLYFQNRDDESRLYKMRTDGSMMSAITDEGAEFVVVVGDRAFYHSWDDGCLYGVNIDGSDRKKLVDSVVMFVTARDGYLYFTEKSEDASLKRIPLTGGEPEVIVECKDLPYLLRNEDGTETYIDMPAPFIQTYFFHDGWVYYYNANNPKEILRASLDERKYEIFFPFDMRVTSINIAGDSLVISFWNERPFEKDGFFISEEIVTIDIDTREKLNHISANTEPILEGPDGWVYYFDYFENYAWYGMSPDGEVIRING